MTLAASAAAHRFSQAYFDPHPKSGLFKPLRLTRTQRKFPGLFSVSPLGLRPVLGPLSLYFGGSPFLAEGGRTRLPGSSRRVSHPGAEIALPRALTPSCGDFAAPARI